MSDRQVAELLDRAVHHAPQMHLTGAEMLVAGQGRVRRRRAVGAGGALGAAALMAAIWSGLAGGDGSVLGTTDIQPATTVWEQGEVVDGRLFTGFQTIADDQVGYSYDARLTRPSGEGPVTLVLSDGGTVVEEIEARSPVPGLEVFAGERMTVAVWTEPEGVDTSVPLVGPRDPGGPSGVQRTQVQGEELAYAVWAGDVVAQPQEVLDVYLMGRDGAVALSGAELEWVRFSMPGHRAQAFADVSRGLVGYAAPDQELVLAQLGDRPAQVTSSSTVAADGVETMMAVLPEGSEVVGLAGGAGDGAELVGTRVMDRPVIMVVREEAAPEQPGVVFDLGGEQHDLDSYVEDLRAIDLQDGTSLTVLSGGAGEPVALGPADAEIPSVTLGDEGGAGQPLLTRTVGGSLVTVATGWDAGASVLADSRVEVERAGLARWVEPTDVAQVALDDGTLVTLLAIDAGAGVDEVTGVGQARGDDIQRWDPPAPGVAGMVLRDVDGRPTPVVDGQEMAEVLGLSIGDARLFRPAGTSAGDDVLVLPAGLDVDDTVVPLLRKGDSLDPAPSVVDVGTVHETDLGRVRVVEVQAGMITESTLLAVRQASVLESGGGNVWGLLDSTHSGHTARDGGLVVTVGGADEGDAWLLYPEGDDSEGSVMRPGLVGATLASTWWLEDPTRLTVVAVLPEGSGGDLLLGPDTELVGVETHPGPLDGLEVFTATVTSSTEQAPADAVEGLDLDGDGEPDLRLPFPG